MHDGPPPITPPPPPPPEHDALSETVLPAPPLPPPAAMLPAPPMPPPASSVPQRVGARRPPSSPGRPLPRRATLATVTLGTSGIALACLADQAFLPATALLAFGTLTWWFPSRD